EGVPGFVGYRANRHRRQHVAGGAASERALHDVVVDLEKLAWVTGPGCACDIRRPSVPRPDDETVSPDVAGVGTCSILVCLQEGDKINEPIVIARVGLAVGSIVIELTPEIRTAGGKRHLVQRTDQQLAHAAYCPRRTGREHAYPVAAVLIVGIGGVGCNPGEHAAFYREVPIG